MILGLNYIEVNDKITYLGTTYVTAAVETKIRTELTRWDEGVGTDFVSIEPMGQNFGARIDPEKEKQDVKKRLASLLYFDELMASGANWGYSKRA